MNYQKDNYRKRKAIKSLGIFAFLFVAVGFLSNQQTFAITRNEVIARAGEYLNLSGYQMNLGGNCGGNYYYSSSATYNSMAYSFGSWDTPDQYMSKVNSGVQTGHSELYNCGSLSAGIDCSGLVSRAWNLPEHVDTSEFYYGSKYSYRLTTYVDRRTGYDMLQPGDAIVSRTGEQHMMLFVGKSSDGKYEVIESTIAGGKLVRKTSYSSNELASRGYVAIRYNNIENYISDDFNKVSTDNINGYYVQTVVGGNRGIYSRSTNDGVFDTEIWRRDGETNGSIESFVYNPGSGDRLYQTHRGDDLVVYTRYTTDGIFDKSTSSEYWQAYTTGKTSSNISMSNLVVNGENRLYQAIKSKSSTSIYTRYYSPNSNSWSGWTMIDGKTLGDITLHTFNNRLIMSVRGDSYPYTVWTRSTTDGAFDNSTGIEIWKAWGQSYTKVSFVNIGNRVYQYVLGTTDSSIFSRYSYDGVNWTEWYTDGNGRAGSSLSLLNNNTGFNNGVLIGMKGSSTDGVFIKEVSTGEIFQIPGGTNTNVDLENTKNSEGQNMLSVTILGKGGDSVYTLQMRDNLDFLDYYVWEKSDLPF